MPSVKKSRIVPFTCAEMYEIVNNVDQYAEFLPHCSQSIIHHRDSDEMQATLMISAVGVNKSFTTRNRLQLNKMIEMRLVDGPFKHFEGFWRFDEIPEGCRISFDLEFEFSGWMISTLLGPVFEQVTEKMVDAFCQRADLLHGQPNSN